MTDATVSNSSPVVVGTTTDQPSRYQSRIAKEEAELAELEAAREPQESTVKPESEDTDKAIEPSSDSESVPVTTEEASFKKRYGDLRRHTAKLEAEHKQRVKELEFKLQHNTQETALPATEDELAEWMESYPELARRVEAVAIQKARGVEDQLNQFRQELETTRQDTVREKALNTIRKSHPDFDDIVDNLDFHTWAKDPDQPDYIRESLYDNSSDPRAVIRTIRSFKADTGYGQKKSKQVSDETVKDASRSIKSGASTPQVADDSRPLFLESQIHAMSPREYAAKAAEIDAAMAKGRVSYDVSGAARY